MNGRRKIRWGVLVAALVATGAVAQPRADSSWVLLATDTLGVVSALNEADASVRALDAMADRGYVYARIDSVGPDQALFLTPGESVRVQRVELVGVASVDDLADGWATVRGERFDRSALESDLAAAAQRYLAAGYPDVELVPRVQLDSSGLVVRVDVAEGARATLAGVELVGGRHASRALATRLSRLRVGDPYQPFDADALVRDLEATGLFLDVGTPVLAMDADRQLVVQVPVRDGPPGAFDLVLGYLPSANGAGGGLVGSGRLELRNPFGGGRRIDVSIDRTPGLVSAFELSVADPFIAGLPIGLAGEFSGYARDSSFSRQRVEAESAVLVAPGLEVSLSAARDAVSPGSFGASLVEGQQRVVRSSAWFLGAGLAYRAVDSPLSPRRGLVLAVAVEQGRRRRTPDAAELAAVSQLQRRLDLRARMYLPTLARQSVVLGVDGQAIVTQRDAQAGDALLYDEGELLRIGGATTLRGYDEEAFLGNVVGRILAEYRLALGPQSFAFGFTDLGYVDQPDLPGRAALRERHLGYGAGVQVRTGIGLATVTYALNPDLPASRGKVHVGLSVGL